MATWETSPCAANWCMDRADGKISITSNAQDNGNSLIDGLTQVLRVLGRQNIFCTYLQSNVAGRTVTSFPRCLLVRVVECLNKCSSSTSMLSGSGDTGPVTGTTTMSGKTGYSLINYFKDRKDQVTAYVTQKKTNHVMTAIFNKKAQVPLVPSSADTEGHTFVLNDRIFTSSITSSSSSASMVTEKNE